MLSLFSFILPLLAIMHVYGDTIGSKVLFGNVHQTMSLELSDNGIATISMTGKPKFWFGVGFGNTVMNGTYAVIVDGEGVITERVLGNHEPGQLLSNSLTLVSSSVNSTVQSIVVTRPSSMNDRFSFNENAMQFPLIWARGTTSDLEYHGYGNKNDGTLNMNSNFKKYNRYQH